MQLTFYEKTNNVDCINQIFYSPVHFLGFSVAYNWLVSHPCIQEFLSSNSSGSFKFFDRFFISKAFPQPT